MISFGNFYSLNVLHVLKTSLFKGLFIKSRHVIKINCLWGSYHIAFTRPDVRGMSMYSKRNVTEKMTNKSKGKSKVMLILLETVILRNPY